MAINSRHVETVFASAARTTTTNSGDFSPRAAFRGVRFYLDVTAASGTTPTLDVTIQGKSPQGDYFNVTGGAMSQLTAAGNEELLIYPGVAETANETVSDVMPGEFRAVATIAGTTPSFTFSLQAEIIP